MGFGPPEGDAEVWTALDAAQARHAMTFALPGAGGSYFCNPGMNDAFIHQELVEILYHTLWETVHVFFFEHRELGPRRWRGWFFSIHFSAKINRKRLTSSCKSRLPSA